MTNAELKTITSKLRRDKTDFSVFLRVIKYTIATVLIIVPMLIVKAKTPNERTFCERVISTWS